ncbi:MAG: pyridoxine 5'-phosphate synthase [Helicobacteraceae bacterium]|jgi:pyridoxine 5-phosphate synthase|nr:pyridoxine 5'-phosphate synthase [Helicobacteraceae bacterium]
MKLGVNIDHIAVLKAARKVGDPDVLQAVFVAAQNGADQITIHLREDRRHIDDYDAKRIVANSPIAVNMECAFGVIDEVLKLRPFRATLVPEKREEVTTEGGLDLEKHFARIKRTVERLKEADIAVSLFVEPSKAAADLALRSGADMIELHTGRFSNLWAALYGVLARTPYAPNDLTALNGGDLKREIDREIKKIKKTAAFARELGLQVAAGHGLNYHNVAAIAAIEAIEELNIGQSIVARAIWTGFGVAAREMAQLIAACRPR